MSDSALWRWLGSKKGPSVGETSTATRAHMGNENKYYYNATLKRWTIRGEEDSIEEEESILPPPKVDVSQIKMAEKLPSSADGGNKGMQSSTTAFGRFHSTPGIGGRLSQNPRIPTSGFVRPKPLKVEDLSELPLPIVEENASPSSPPQEEMNSSREGDISSLNVKASSFFDEAPPFSYPPPPPLLNESHFDIEGDAPPSLSPEGGEKWPTSSPSSPSTPPYIGTRVRHRVDKISSFEKQKQMPIDVERVPRLDPFSPVDFQREWTLRPPFPPVEASLPSEGYGDGHTPHMEEPVEEENFLSKESYLRDIHGSHDSNLYPPMPPREESTPPTEGTFPPPLWSEAVDLHGYSSPEIFNLNPASEYPRSSIPPAIPPPSNASFVTYPPPSSFSPPPSSFLPPPSSFPSPASSSPPPASSSPPPASSSPPPASSSPPPPSSFPSSSPPPPSSFPSSSPPPASSFPSRSIVSLFSPPTVPRISPPSPIVTSAFISSCSPFMEKSTFQPLSSLEVLPPLPSSALGHPPSYDASSMMIGEELPPSTPIPPLSLLSPSSPFVEPESLDSTSFVSPIFHTTSLSNPPPPAISHYPKSGISSPPALSPLPSLVKMKDITSILPPSSPSPLPLSISPPPPVSLTFPPSSPSPPPVSLTFPPSTVSPPPPLSTVSPPPPLSTVSPPPPLSTVSPPPPLSTVSPPPPPSTVSPPPPLSTVSPPPPLSTVSPPPPPLSTVSPPPPLST
ncbi:surface antigen repeat-containing protein, partial [Cardiosporidium cionae]